MYSRNRVMSAEQRYAENLPPVYGGSRFYRGTAAVPREPRPERETEIAVTPAAGIPVEYTVRPGGIPDAPLAEETCVPQEDAVPVLRAGEGTPDEHMEAPGRIEKSAREGGLASLLSGDSEEILLIVLILLLGGEAERAADMLVILLLLLVVR